MHKTVELHGSPKWDNQRGAKGRNGWFRPVRAIIHVEMGDVSGLTVDIDSRRLGGSPISLNLSREDWVALTEAVHDAARGE